MLIGSVFFGLMGLLTESLGSEYSFAWIAAIRSAIATILAIALAKLGGAKLVYFRPRTLWMRSLAGCSAMMCIFFAMTHYDVSVILALTSTYPIWVAVLSWPMLGESPSRDTWFALVVSSLGMALVFLGTTSLNAGAVHHEHYQPYLAVPLAALAAIFSGVALIGLHQVKEIDSRAVVAHFSCVSTIIAFAIWWTIPTAGAIDGEFATPDSTSLWRLLGVGVTATLGQLFLTKAFAAGSPARVSVVGLSQVAVAALYKWFVVGNYPSQVSLIGMSLLLFATGWILLRKKESL